MREPSQVSPARHRLNHLEAAVFTAAALLLFVPLYYLVETTNAAISGLVSDNQIRELPLNGRSFVQLSLLEPGVVQARSASVNVATGSGLQLSFNGARSRMNNYLMDGTSINSGNAGRITATVTDPRQMQFGLKLAF